MQWSIKWSPGQQSKATLVKELSQQECSLQKEAKKQLLKGSPQVTKAADSVILLHPCENPIEEAGQEEYKWLLHITVTQTLMY